MTVGSALTFVGYFKAKDLAVSHPKLLPGTADLPETLQLGHVRVINLAIRDNLPVLIPLNTVLKIASILSVFTVMNTLEAKGRTGLGPGAFMGNVEALKECPRPNTLFERIKRRKNLLILRLDQPVGMKTPDREKLSIYDGNQMLGTARLRGRRLTWASGQRHHHSEYTAELGRTYFNNKNSEVMCWALQKYEDYRYLHLAILAVNVISEIAPSAI
jgi:hypothetical protein